MNCLTDILSEDNNNYAFSELTLLLNVSTKNITYKFSEEMSDEDLTRCISNLEKGFEPWKNNTDFRLNYKGYGENTHLTITTKYLGYFCIGIGKKIIGKKDNMNIQDLSKIKEDDIYHITHEFGHVLGLKHEHQRKTDKYALHESTVIGYVKKITGWDSEKIRTNVLQKLDGDCFNGEYDPKSIMHYCLDGLYKVVGNNLMMVEPTVNKTLSEGDIKFCRQHFIFGNKRNENKEEDKIDALLSMVMGLNNKIENIEENFKKEVQDIKNRNYEDFLKGRFNDNLMKNDRNKLTRRNKERVIGISDQTNRILEAMYLSLSIGDVENYLRMLKLYGDFFHEEDGPRLGDGFKSDLLELKRYFSKSK